MTLCTLPLADLFVTNSFATSETDGNGDASSIISSDTWTREEASEAQSAEADDSV